MPEKGVRPKNCKCIADMTPEEKHAYQSAGGKAAARKKKERRELKETLLLLLAEGNVQDNVCLSLIQQAINGNVKAFNAIRDTIGEMPVQKQEVKVEDNTIHISIEDITDDKPETDE